MPKIKAITFEDILKQPTASDAWSQLKDVSEADLHSIRHHLIALANQRPLFEYSLPSPRDARRFADHLKRDAAKIRRMNLYFGSGLPLGNPTCRNLPEIIERYADVLSKASRSRPRRRPPDDALAREVEIVRLVYQSGRHYYAEVADLIQAAYDAGSLHREMDANQLQKLYNRQSLKRRLKHKVEPIQEEQPFHH